MKYEEKEALKDLAHTVRLHVLDMAVHGGCFVGAAFSCTEMLVYLYRRFLRVSPAAQSDPNRDYFFLSKGHAVPALYGVLAEQGFFDPRRLRQHLSDSDLIYLHPNAGIPGVEFHSGSLGHSLSVAVGVGLEQRLHGGGGRVVVMLGDGELNEGSIWESLLQAARLHISNVLVIVDRNRFQANFKTEELVPLEPLPEKFESFGAVVRVVNGHDFEAIDAVLQQFPFQEGSPSVLIADTIRGKGVPSIEEDWEKWFVALSEEEHATLSGELATHQNRQ